MDRFEIGDLRCCYGALLSERQNEMLRLHFDDDMSYGELSEMFGITRQAAFDAVKKGSAFLEKFEQQLGFCERDAKILSLLEEIDQNADADTKQLTQSIKKLLED